MDQTSLSNTAPLPKREERNPYMKMSVEDVLVCFEKQKDILEILEEEALTFAKKEITAARGVCLAEGYMVQTRLAEIEHQVGLMEEALSKKKKRETAQNKKKINDLDSEWGFVERKITRSQKWVSDGIQKVYEEYPVPVDTRLSQFNIAATAGLGSLTLCETKYKSDPLAQQVIYSSTIILLSVFIIGGELVRRARQKRNEVNAFFQKEVCDNEQKEKRQAQRGKCKKPENTTDFNLP